MFRALTESEHFIQAFSKILRYIQRYWGIYCASLAYSQPCHILLPCETLARHIQSSAIGHYSAIFRNIQNFVQRLHIQKPGILRILHYSVLFHNCILKHIQNLVIFTKIYEYSKSDIFKTRFIFRTLSKI